MTLSLNITDLLFSLRMRFRDKGEIYDSGFSVVNPRILRSAEEQAQDRGFDSETGGQSAERWLGGVL
jgi:hypothetical protein